MKHLQHQDLLKSFPRGLHPQMRSNQEEALRLIALQDGSATLELPTGSGKTAIGYTFLKALEMTGAGPLFYITPTKAQVDQVHGMHPDMRVAYGRSEHPCLYYPEQNLRADEIPCSLLVDCAHRVNQETGETKEPGAAPCPYLLQKFQAKKGRIVVCTMSFYLFTQLFSREWEKPAGLVVDEAHQIAKVVRNALSYEITDYRLRRVVEILKKIGATQEAEHLDEFLRRMIHIIKRKPRRTPALLEEHEIRELMEVLQKIDIQTLRNKVTTAVAQGTVDPDRDRVALKQLEVIARDLRHYLLSFEYSLPAEHRQPLNYTYAFYEEELEEGKRVHYRLVIRSYYVAPLIQRILGERTVAYSATIGDAQVFGWETGIRYPAYALVSDFPVEHTKVFMPNDTPNLAMRERSRQQPTRILRKIAKTCRQFADHNLRSLVVVVSEAERQKFLMLCNEESVDAVSYGNGVPARQAAAAFKAGKGEVLVGTTANYGEGIDLPGQLAPVIFFLRPGYPSPNDPATQFEERRFGSQRWKLWTWRVMMESLQARGRNIRSREDIGVTFFVSQQFRRFLWASLPVWLREAYVPVLTFDECIEEAEKLLVISEHS